MKLLSSILVMFVTTSVMAQQAPLDPARQAELNARNNPGVAVAPGGYLVPNVPGAGQRGDLNIPGHDHGGSGLPDRGDHGYHGGWFPGHHGPGHGGPGYPPGYGYPPPPPPPLRPLPPPPPPPPAQNYDVGPRVTVRWIDDGARKVDKVISDLFVVNVGNVWTNEVRVRCLDKTLNVQSALAYLSNGSVVNLAALLGTINAGQERASSLDYNYSLRVNRIEIKATTQSILGSRSQIQILVGTAQ